MAEFDLSALMKDVSKSDTSREQIRYIAWASIRPAENNGYSMDGLEDLARSIELVGLQQPLRVRPLADNSVEVISGHRRRAAIGLLIDRGSQRFDAGVPCIVDSSAASPALRELQLLLGNADNRKLTSADEAQQAERISDCIRRLEDEGFNFPGRHRDWVAKLSGMSRSKLARLDAIRHRLAPGLRVLYEEGELNESVAYEFSKFDHTKQDRIWDDLAEANLEFTVENVQRAAGRPPKETPPPQTKKLPADSTVWLKPKDAYRRRTSIRTAASALGIMPEKSIQEQLEDLMRNCRSYRGVHGPGYDVQLRPPCHVILDENTRYERRYKIKQFLELVAEVWIENDLNAFQADAVRTDVPEGPAKQEISARHLGWLACTPPDRQRAWAKYRDEDMSEFTMLAHYDAEQGIWHAGIKVTGICPIDQTCIGWWPLPEDDAPDLPGDLTPREPEQPTGNVSESGTPAEWGTGKPPKPGLYAVRFKTSETAPGEIHNFARWTGYGWKAVRSGRVINDLIASAWYPIPEVDA